MRLSVLTENLFRQSGIPYTITRLSVTYEIFSYWKGPSIKKSSTLRIPGRRMTCVRSVFTQWGDECFLVMMCSQISSEDLTQCWIKLISDPAAFPDCVLTFTNVSFFTPEEFATAISKACTVILPPALAVL